MLENKQPAKATVQYRPSVEGSIKVGYSALVWPVDHTSPFVSNEQVAVISKVISYDPETGVFETLNSIYKPFKETDYV